MGYGDVLEELGGTCNSTESLSNESSSEEVEEWGQTCHIAGDDNSNGAFLARVLDLGEGLCDSVAAARMVLWIYGDCNQEFLGTGYNPGGAEGIVLPNQDVPSTAATLPLGDADCSNE